ncbi:uncharacterized oxidoreductase At1g06690, chloroplastic isoform X2 [Citrus sinensis]|uniref:uncharacterized oxidoreductase At1g06690, chloroplastic isoform X2 n=1 Tax=Citrus sinensis TaxID=2711 RepID=UPI002278A9F2|nr:uncharacterized oxidoreductase At1g06690, chloroplastic isoform X2 [Citrus sinensis]
MAMHVSGACFSVFSGSRVGNIRAVASEGFATVKTAEDKVKLGGSDLKVTKLGVGAWSWGDTSYWNNFQWDDRKMKAAKAAFDTSLDNGITFFDTAEVYGSRASFGAINSETLLGRFIKERKQRDPEVEVTVATKFAALPWRLGRQSVLAALKDSLFRLGLSSVELYQLHWAGIWGNEGFIDGLGDAVEQGLVKAVGVSNYSEKRLRNAYEKLKKRGIPLASNQVNYSLIYRKPEENGVKAACDELGITLIAYCPIAQGSKPRKRNWWFHCLKLSDENQSVRLLNLCRCSHWKVYTTESTNWASRPDLHCRVSKKSPTTVEQNQGTRRELQQNFHTGRPQLAISPGQCCANPRSQKCRTGCRIRGCIGMETHR